MDIAVVGVEKDLSKPWVKANLRYMSGSKGECLSVSRAHDLGACNCDAFLGFLSHLFYRVRRRHSELRKNKRVGFSVVFKCSTRIVLQSYSLHQYYAINFARDAEREPKSQDIYSKK